MIHPTRHRRSLIGWLSALLILLNALMPTIAQAAHRGGALDLATPVWCTTGGSLVALAEPADAEDLASALLACPCCHSMAHAPVLPSAERELLPLPAARPPLPPVQHHPRPAARARAIGHPRAPPATC